MSFRRRLLVVTLVAVFSTGCCRIFPWMCEDDQPPPYTTTTTFRYPTTVPSTPPTTEPSTPPTTIPGSCTPPTIDPDKSLVVHDPAALATPFAFRKTIDAIIASSGGTPTTADAFVQTMLTSFNATSFPNPVSGKQMPVDQRPAEAGLSAAQLLDPASPVHMVPIGLFNRLDLAPSDGSNCGEYRIVYAKIGGLGRFFIIFESKLPNPVPASGLAGCLPVAKFWADLTAEPNPATRIAALESFYYQGLTASGFGPVVTHANYGIPFGQVRTNLFVAFPWQLREHRTGLDGSGRPVFVVDTVKDTPLVELFRVPATLPGGFTTADQQAFRAHFHGRPTCNLLRPDRANPGASNFEIVNGIGLGIDDEWNEFQALSDSSDDPANGTDAPLLADIATRLTQLGSATVTPPHLLARSGAMACGGCHQFSSGRALDTLGHQWPPSLGFVHIDESGNVSPALTAFFLPRRKAILERFLCDPSAEPSKDPDCPPMQGGPGGSGPTSTPPPSGTPPPYALEASVATKLRQGRVEPSLVKVDDARMAFLAAAQRATTGPEQERPVASRDAKTAAALLDSLVRAARTEERRKPGAFIPVRRTH